MVEKVTRWLRIYCRAVATMFLIGTMFGVWVIRNRSMLAVEVGGPEMAFVAFGVLWSLLLLLLSLLHLAVGSAPRAPWAWTITAVVLGLDLTTLFLWPFALPILWMWMKNDVQVAYGRKRGVTP